MEVVDKNAWVNFYKNTLFSHILKFEGRQNELAQILKDLKKQVDQSFKSDKTLDENGNIIEEPKHHTEIDPFTVISLINVGTLKKRSTLHSGLLNRDDFRVDLTGCAESDAQSAWYYPYRVKQNGSDIYERPKEIISRLWGLFRKLAELKDIKEIEKIIIEILPQDVIGINKLSTGLYRCRPDLFFPLNATGKAFLDKSKISYTDTVVETEDKALQVWNDYLDTLKRIKETFKDQEFYDLYYQAVVDVNRSRLNKGHKQEDNNLSTKNKIETNMPLNQILYGPPGTGKTYATTELAVQIAAPDWYASLTETDTIEHHKAIKEKYDELIKTKQIAFTTFHQSFSYEDFIEGLKAYVPEGQTNIAYKVEDGILKKIAIKAQKAAGINKNDVLGLNSSPKIWKISLGETWDVERRKKYFENSEIRIGWNATGNLLTERNEDQIKYFESLGSNDQTSLNDFSEGMKIGDVILCLRDRKSIQAIGVISSDYYFDEQAYELDSDFAHVRKVKWLATGINFNILALNNNFQLGIKSVHELARISWVQLVEELKAQDIIIEEIHNPKTLITNSVNHVLIMDEINRGNISKIFGELITLIEDDKRAGKSDARELTLPYSKEPFTVPSNLYLISTMNTADKSLTQLDLALRRRFEFKEVGPDSQILEDMEASQHDVDIPLMLKKMNQRIQYLKGKDYQIGHSYFMPLCSVMDETKYLETLRRIFENKIIPLLQEYFFSNLKHIGLVLNDNPDDMDERKIIQDLNFDENIFGYGQQPKGNPLFAVELNLGCFSDLKRFQQIYH